jgi:hypothetical protein
MPVELTFLENGRVAYYKMTEPWNVQAVTALYARDAEYRDSVEFKVHTIIDLTEIRRVPATILASRAGSPALQHPRRGHTLVVGAPAQLKTLIEVITRVARFDDAHLMDTLDEGWAYLREVIAKGG